MASSTCIVMAGGLGTRMRSSQPKVLHELCGRPMLEWVVAAARAAGSDRVVAVVSPEIEAAVRARLPDLTIAVQDPPNGTGHAVQVGLAALGPARGPVVVLSGDTPCIDPGLIARAAAAGDGAAAALVSTRVAPPHAYGRVVRGADGGVLRVVEARDAAAEELALDEINVGLYCFDGEALAHALARIGPHNAQGELYLTDAVGEIAADGGSVVAVEEPDVESCAGVNTMVELAEREAELRRRLCSAAMLAGVRVVDPPSTQLDWDVELEPGCRIEPFTTLRDGARVASGAVVGPYAMVVGAVVGPDCRVGPFAYLRPGTVLQQGAQAGRFVELKNTEIGAGSKVPHLSYLGDALVGPDTNIGAGNITANYDGAAKHRTVIGARVRTSCDTIFVAPVEIGDDAVTGAGSVITDDVPPGALGIARPRQEVIEGYAARVAARRGTSR
jgi:bifunctional UDP-N-acetylglucosamine pyrophosphorylase/glucosamine-1-phosphate N-acetyltransferase